MEKNKDISLLFRLSLKHSVSFNLTCPLWCRLQGTSRHIHIHSWRSLFVWKRLGQHQFRRWQIKGLLHRKDYKRLFNNASLKPESPWQLSAPDLPAQSLVWKFSNTRASHVPSIIQPRKLGTVTSTSASLRWQLSTLLSAASPSSGSLKCNRSVFWKWPL